MGIPSEQNVYFFSKSCRHCGMILYQTACGTCARITDEGHWEHCSERLSGKQGCRRCPQTEDIQRVPYGSIDGDCDVCEQAVRIVFCKTCDGYFWQGHTRTCAVPAMFPALEQHFQKCVLHSDFDADKIVC